MFPSCCLECRCKGWSTSTLPYCEYEGSSLEVVEWWAGKRSLGPWQVCEQALDCRAYPRLILCDKKWTSIFSEPPSFWIFLLHLSELIPHGNGAAQHIPVGSLDEWSFSKKCWTGIGDFTWVGTIFSLNTHFMCSTGRQKSLLQSCLLQTLEKMSAVWKTCAKQKLLLGCLNRNPWIVKKMK